MKFIAALSLIAFVAAQDVINSAASQASSAASSAASASQSAILNSASAVISSAKSINPAASGAAASSAVKGTTYSSDASSTAPVFAVAVMAAIAAMRQ